MTETLSIVEQLRRAAQRQNRLALLAGMILGGFVPVASYVLAHHEVGSRPALWILVAGALVFSGISVYETGVVAFQNRAKAGGFVILIEGVLIFSVTSGLGWSALALLVAINAMATGTNVALDHRGRLQDRAERGTGVGERVEWQDNGRGMGIRVPVPVVARRSMAGKKRKVS